eukprot:3265928-Pyramimonas_sp.AAC.3
MESPTTRCGAELASTRLRQQPLTRVVGHYAGRTPLDIATDEGEKEVAALLRAHGAHTALELAAGKGKEEDALKPGKSLLVELFSLWINRPRSFRVC